MSKNLAAFLSCCVLVAGIFWSHYGRMPQELWGSGGLEDSEFSTERAFQHVQTIAKEPHFVGTEAHGEVRSYLVSELESLGLEVEIQEGWSLNKRGILTRPHNILARKPGSSPALSTAGDNPISSEGADEIQKKGADNEVQRTREADATPEERARNHAAGEKAQKASEEEASAIPSENFEGKKGGRDTSSEGKSVKSTLLLLSHYDSAVHSSPGASDAASGVATILEGLRAFLTSGQSHANDILVVFTDAEELGLNGANLLLEHPWAQHIKLALNFESRGSGGSSFMLLETNAGNEQLIRHFAAANPEYPVTNSLAYSVYKMLPNDTDLTVLREQGDINGFNFAFIDDHFDYHTATDTPANLDRNTLAHQGSYLMPLLDYFSEAPLENLDSQEDVIYFNVPVLGMVNYPFSWSFPLLYTAVALFLLLLLYGFLTKHFYLREILKGFLPMLLALVLSGLLAYLLWRFCLLFYPQYQEMEHGFTYNGYYYIGAVIFLALGICFYTYRRFQVPGKPGALFVAPLFFWILLSALAALYLEGAAYFIIPVFFGLLQLFLLIRVRKPNPVFLSLLSLPAVFVLMPFVQTIPVALGLQALFLTAVLVVLLWILLWPVIGFYSKNQLLGFLCMLVFFGLFITAHFKADFNEERPKPNSLVYLLDEDSGTATWNTYDELPDAWSEAFMGEAALPANGEALFSSKYHSGFARSTQAPVVEVQGPTLHTELLSSDSLGMAHYQVEIIPNRDINRIELYTKELVDFNSFRVNGQTAMGLGAEADALHIFTRRWSKRLLSYYALNRDTLRLDFRVEDAELPEIMLYEASFDLLENEHLGVPPRNENMIPRPFVLNDAVVVKKRLVLEREEEQDQEKRTGL